MAASSERDSARLLPARPMVSNVGREPGAGAPSALASGRLAVNEVGGDDVFHRDTDRLEERDLVRGLPTRSEEHTSELQSPCNLVCRLLLEKKKNEPRLTRVFTRDTRCQADAPPTTVYTAK